MFSSSIIVFREVLEIALLISIISAATSTIKSGKKMIFIGVITGCLSSIIFAFAIHKISYLLSNLGQEILNIIIQTTTISLLSLTLIWMNNKSKDISKNIRNKTSKVVLGQQKIYYLILIVALIILREGAEISLFLYGLWSSGSKFYEIISGLFIGLLSGISTGFVLYYGLLKIKPYWLFKITNLLIIFLIASITVDLVNNLQAANLISFTQNHLWDSSNFVSQHSIIGKSLHVLFGYLEKPNIVHLSTYLTTIILLSYSISKKKPNPSK